MKKEINCRLSISEIQAIPQDEFDAEIAEMTQLNMHTEARALKAKRTGDKHIAFLAMDAFFTYQQKGRKSILDEEGDRRIDSLIEAAGNYIPPPSISTQG